MTRKTKKFPRPLWSQELDGLIIYFLQITLELYICDAILTDKTLKALKLLTN